jgi:hypothetical protein
MIPPEVAEGAALEPAFVGTAGAVRFASPVLVQGVVSRVEVEDDLLGRSLVGFEEQLDEQTGERFGVVIDVVEAVVRAARRAPVG